VLIKGLTPGLTTSNLTRREPKTIDELFYELQEHIKSDEDHRRVVVERINKDKVIEEQHGDLITRTHETSIMWKIHSSTSTVNQAQEEVLCLEEEEGEEDP
jgi:hypothetical protein